MQYKLIFKQAFPVKTMSLLIKIEKYLPSEYMKLTGVERDLLNDDEFKTESCGDCSHFRWGKCGEGGKYREDKDGGIACCNLDNVLYELGFDPGAVWLSAKEALKWWFNEGLGEPRGLFLEHRCRDYDGKFPYSREGIINYIEKRNALIERITGFKADNTFDKMPDYFMENLALTNVG